MAAPLESNWWRFKCYKELDGNYTSTLEEWMEYNDGRSHRFQETKNKSV